MAFLQSAFAVLRQIALRQSEVAVPIRLPKADCRREEAICHRPTAVAKRRPSDRLRLRFRERSVERDELALFIEQRERVQRLRRGLHDMLELPQWTHL